MATELELQHRDAMKLESKARQKFAYFQSIHPRIAKQLNLK